MLDARTEQTTAYSACPKAKGGNWLEGIKTRSNGKVVVGPIIGAKLPWCAHRRRTHASARASRPRGPPRLRDRRARPGRRRDRAVTRNPRELGWTTPHVG